MWKWTRLTCRTVKALYGHDNLHMQSTKLGSTFDH